MTPKQLAHLLRELAYEPMKYGEPRLKEALREAALMIAEQERRAQRLESTGETEKGETP